MCISEIAHEKEGKIRRRRRGRLREAANFRIDFFGAFRGKL